MAAFQLYPEYMYFTGVEITLTIDGETGGQQSFSISKIDDYYTHKVLKEQGYLQSLVIKEGTLGNGQQLVVPDVGGGIASGIVRLVDKDNAIFLSLLASKSKDGNQLLNRLDITLKTYTGPKSYKNCRINKWTCDFNGGVPTINLEWQSIGGDNAPAFSDSSSPSFNPNLAKIRFVDEGVTEDFGYFILKIKEIYKNTFSFKYTTEKTVRVDSLKDIGTHGDIEYFNNNILTKSRIIIPKDCLSPSSSNKLTYRFKLNSVNESLSFLTNVMKEICSIAKIENTDLHINWKLIDGNIIFIYTYKDMGNIALPEEGGVTQALANSVFIYNSSFPQGSLYTTPQGSKVAFTIDSISASFDFSQVLLANVDPQSNASCPNGNMFITSRGAIMIPPQVPAQVQKTIQEIKSLNLTQNFTVKMTVYNFVQFYVMGNTLIDLVVFDHMGNIHPMTGKMRVVGYQYEIGSGGVVKADVTLAPPFSVTDPNFTNTTPAIAQGSDDSDTSFEEVSKGVIEDGSSRKEDMSGGRVDFDTGVPNVSTGKAKIDINAYGTSSNDVDGLPQFLGVKVKALPDYNYAVERTKYFKEKPKWVFVHYTAGFKTAKGVANFFLGKDASTHFACDPKDVYRVVKEDQPAIHTQNSTKYPYQIPVSWKEFKDKKGNIKKVPSKWDKDPNVKPILKESDIYRDSENPNPVYPGHQAINFKSNMYWRYDLPSHNHTIWKEIEDTIKSGEDVKDQWGNSYKGCIKNGVACGNANAYSFGVDLCDYRLETDKKKYDDNVGKTDWFIDPKTIENGAKTVAYLCYKYDIPVSRVMRHCDSTGKPCLPINKTEIFTPNGFIPLNKIKKEDIVFQYNIETNMLEETKILSVVEPYKSVICKNRGYEATLNHRTLVKTQRGVIKTEPFENFLGKRVALFNSCINNNEGIPLTDDEIRFLVQVQGDGSFSYKWNKNRTCKSYRGIRFHLKKERKIFNVYSLLDRLGYKYYLHKCKDSTTVINIPGKDKKEFLDKWLCNKHFTSKLYNMSKNQFLVFLDELWKVDTGSTSNKLLYCTKEKENLDIVQGLCAINNIRTYYYTLKNGCYVLSIIRSDYSLSKNLEFYEDFVSCIEVSSGYIMIRQNGNTFITGNCPRPLVSLPQDGSFKNELKWKILRRKSDNQIITPDTYAESGVLDYSYSYDPRIHLIETEDSEADITKRTSFLGKVSGYIEVLKEQGYPKYSGNLK